MPITKPTPISCGCNYFLTPDSAAAALFSVLKGAYKGDILSAVQRSLLKIVLEEREDWEDEYKYADCAHFAVGGSRGGDEGKNIATTPSEMDVDKTVGNEPSGTNGDTNVATGPSNKEGGGAKEGTTLSTHLRVLI